MKRGFRGTVGPQEGRPSKAKRSKSQPKRRVAPKTAAVLRSEKKVLDLAYATYAITTTGSVTLLNGIAGGTDFNQRVGRRVKITDVMIQGMVAPEDATTDDVYCTVMLVYDNAPNQALATIAEIFSQANGTSFLNLNNRDRFKVLSTDRFTIGQRSNTATVALAASPGTVPINRYIKTQLGTVFDAATGTIADITTGAILLVTLGDEPSGTGASFFASTRVRFTDV